MLGSASEADDVAQEAVLRAWRARHSCGDVAAREAWLARITRREVYRYASRRSSRREDLGTDATGEGSAADEPLERVEQRIDVRGALRSLGALDRRLIALRYEHDMTYSSTANLLGMPEGTVKVRIHRAHRRLAAALAERNR